MSINLIAWRKRNLQIAFRKNIFRLALFSVACLFFIIFTHFYLLHQIRVIHARKNKIAQMSRKIIITDDDTYHQTLLKQLNLLYPKIKSDRRADLRIESILRSIANDLPNEIVLQSLTLTQKKLTFSGISNNIADIHRYNDALQKNHIGSTILLSNIHADSHATPNLLFTMEIML